MLSMDHTDSVHAVIPLPSADSFDHLVGARVERVGLRQPLKLKAAWLQCWTITVAPIFARAYRSTMSSLVNRIQPDDTAPPMFQGSLVP